MYVCISLPVGLVMKKLLLSEYVHTYVRMYIYICIYMCICLAVPITVDFLSVGCHYTGMYVFLIVLDCVE